MAWAKNGTPDTLTVAGDSALISDQTSTTFNQIMYNVINTSTINQRFRLGNSSIDTGSNYSSREEADGGTDTTRVSQTSLINNVLNDSALSILYIINISAEQKFVISFMVERGTVGAGNAPHRLEMIGQWVNTSNQFDNVEIVNTSGGSFDVDSNISALGTD